MKTIPQHDLREMIDRQDLDAVVRANDGDSTAQFSAVDRLRLLWAGALITTGAVPLFRDAYYYVAVTYTTLGYAEGTLGPQWRILAPMMAMSGLFAFGWTISVLFSIVGVPPPGDANGDKPR